ncbi:MAG: hypothetical protein EZS28_015317, partial [Streblomastix strix]
IADNLHAVQVDSEYCRCNNSFDQTKMHIVQLDTDSLTLAIRGDKNRGPEYRFDAVIKDVEFYNKNKGFFFSYDNQRKILGVHIEKQGLNCIALSPKNYIINDECGDVSLVAKGVILRQNPQINEQTFVDNTKSGTVMKVTYTILAQKNKIMSKLSNDKEWVLDGLNRCDAKLDARIAGGFVYPYRDKNKTACVDDQAFFLRKADELPKIISKKGQKESKMPIFEQMIANITVAIDAIEQLHIDWHAIFKTIWEAAIKYACESKICY